MTHASTLPLTLSKVTSSLRSRSSRAVCVVDEATEGFRCVGAVGATLTRNIPSDHFEMFHWHHPQADAQRHQAHHPADPTLTVSARPGGSDEQVPSSTSRNAGATKPL